MKCCPNLEKCGFVKKYSTTDSLAVKGFVSMYCQGEKQDECKRKTYKAQHGAIPSDDMLPNGSFVHKEPNPGQA